MFHFGTLDRGFWLTQSVARVLGVNLTTALAERRLDRRSYARMISQCEGCSAAAACTVWAAQQHGINASAPAFCPNRDALDRLARMERR